MHKKGRNVIASACCPRVESRPAWNTDEWRIVQKEVLKQKLILFRIRHSV